VLHRTDTLLDKNDARIAGGKASSLGEMTKAGFAVPAGFVILTNAFEFFLRKNNLIAKIETIMNSIEVSNIDSIENASQKIRHLIIKAKIPSEITEAITNSFKDLNTTFVAVRSSATSEDSAIASWAGQLESYLNTTKNELLPNVKKCWASLFSTRAIFYRFEKKSENSETSVAVIIQKMIQSEKSGTAFSIHPVTLNTNQILIEAAFGLGEGVVSGQITPDSYIVEKMAWNILSRSISDKNRMLIKASQSGNEWKKVPTANVKKQVLSDVDIITLSKQVVDLENHFGVPIDVEWAQENNKQYIVQARPITRLKKDREEETVSVADKFIELMVEQKLYNPVHNFTLFAGLTGWTSGKYYNKYFRDRTPMPCLVISKDGEGIFYLSQTKMENLAHEVFEDYWKERSTLHERMNKFKKFLKEVDTVYNKMTPSYIERNSIPQLLKHVGKINDLAWSTNALGWFSLYFDKEFCIQELNKIETGITHGINSIWENAIEPTSNSFDQRKFKLIIELLSKGYSWDQIAEKVQYAYVSYEHIPTLIEIVDDLKHLFSKYKNPERAKAKLVHMNKDEAARVAKHKGWLSKLAKNERELVFYTQTIIETRDVLRDVIGKALAVTYRVAQKTFREAEVSDRYILFSMRHEIEKGLKYLQENKQHIQDRAHGCAALMKYDGNVYLENSDYEINKEKLNTFYLSQHKTSINLVNEIKGQTGWIGKARGKVKIVLSFKRDKSKFHEGDILVTGMTRPEFVPLMRKAAAIITDEGGITCHAAIVSRELNKPCVIGTKIATQVLQDDELVEVDAHRGVITMKREKK